MTKKQDTCPLREFNRCAFDKTLCIEVQCGDMTCCDWHMTILKWHKGIIEEDYVVQR